jgi:hypothetical protein
MDLTACADAPIPTHHHVACVTPMYRVQFRGFRSPWAPAESARTTPRQFVREKTDLDLAAIQSASRVFIEYAFSVEVRVSDHAVITGRWHITEGSPRSVMDAFVRRHTERFGYVAPIAVGLWPNCEATPSYGPPFLRHTGRFHYYVVPQEGCSFCACDAGLFSVGMVTACGGCLAELVERKEHGIAEMPILPRTPALTDTPSEFDPPHVERLRLMHAMALCMQRAPHQTAPLAAVASTTSEFRGMVADALASRVGTFRDFH